MKYFFYLNQGFPKGGDFEICSDELILDILDLQMKSTKKKVLAIYIGDFRTYTRYSEVASLRGRLPFKTL